MSLAQRKAFPTFSPLKKAAEDPKGKIEDQTRAVHMNTHPPRMLEELFLQPEEASLDFPSSDDPFNLDIIAPTTPDIMITILIDEVAHEIAGGVGVVRHSLRGDFLACQAELVDQEHNVDVSGLALSSCRTLEYGFKLRVEHQERMEDVDNRVVRSDGNGWGRGIKGTLEYNGWREYRAGSSIWNQVATASY